MSNSERKPFKSGGDFVRDGDGRKLLLTPHQCINRSVAYTKRLGIDLHVKEHVLNDFGDHYTVTAVAARFRSNN